MLAELSAWRQKPLGHAALPTVATVAGSVGRGLYLPGDCWDPAPLTAGRPSTCSMTWSQLGIRCAMVRFSTLKFSLLVGLSLLLLLEK